MSVAKTGVNGRKPNKDCAQSATGVELAAGDGRHENLLPHNALHRLFWRKRASAVLL
jgi:hypothetical protein